MKKLLKSVPIIAIPMLVACTGEVDEVKESQFPGQATYSVGQVLENRDICEDVLWDQYEDDRGASVVMYRCEYKGAAEYYEDKNVPMAGVQEYMEWNLTDNGPVIRGAGIMFWVTDERHFIQSGRYSADSLLSRALENEYETFSDLANEQVGPIPDVSVVRRKSSQL